MICLFEQCGCGGGGGGAVGFPSEGVPPSLEPRYLGGRAVPSDTRQMAGLTFSGWRSGPGKDDKNLEQTKRKDCAFGLECWRNLRIMG